jgi:signal transduction histidine kinase
MDPQSMTLLSTVLSLPDDERAAVERSLVGLARSAALGELAADVGHDVANPLFGLVGLVDLLREGAEPGSEDAERLELLRDAASDMKTTLRSLLDFARPPADVAPAGDLGAAVRSAAALVRHGIGRLFELDERYPEAPVVVACTEPLLAQASLHLLAAARAAGGPAQAIVEPGGLLRVSPAGVESLGTLAAARIAADNGGRLDRDGQTFVLTLPPA